MFLKQIYHQATFGVLDTTVLLFLYIFFSYIRWKHLDGLLLGKGHFHWKICLETFHWRIQGWQRHVTTIFCHRAFKFTVCFLGVCPLSVLCVSPFFETLSSPLEEASRQRPRGNGGSCLWHCTCEVQGVPTDLYLLTCRSALNASQWDSFKGAITSRSEQTFKRTWNRCPNLRWTQWLEITASFMQQYHVG